jgi:hypothetical protein
MVSGCWVCLGNTREMRGRCRDPDTNKQQFRSGLGGDGCGGYIMQSPAALAGFYRHHPCLLRRGQPPISSKLASRSFLETKRVSSVPWARVIDQGNNPHIQSRFSRGRCGLLSGGYRTFQTQAGISDHSTPSLLLPCHKQRVWIWVTSRFRFLNRGRHQESLFAIPDTSGLHPRFLLDRGRNPNAQLPVSSSLFQDLVVVL